MTEGEGRLAGRAAEGVIARVVGSLVRDAEEVTAATAGKDAAGDAARAASSDAASGAVRHVDLAALPSYHAGGQPDLFGSANVPPDYKPFGDLSRQEFYDRHYSPEKGSWDYPPDDGFAGDRGPSALQPGDQIDRYGLPTGGYTSPADTSFEQRALPPTNLTQPYYRYEVVRPLPSGVSEGRVAPAFEQPGGGVQQYFGEHPVQWYVDQGYLKQVYP